jgi:prevent-host-death family protein
MERSQSVGIRQLKEQASSLVRRVASGETISITDRGRPVAQIIPLHESKSFWDQMIESGRLVPARHDLVQILEDNPPLPLMPGERSPYDALMEMRADER